MRMLCELRGALRDLVVDSKTGAEFFGKVGVALQGDSSAHEKQRQSILGSVDAAFTDRTFRMFAESTLGKLAYSAFDSCYPAGVFDSMSNVEATSRLLQRLEAFPDGGAVLLFGSGSKARSPSPALKPRFLMLRADPFPHDAGDPDVLVCACTDREFPDSPSKDGLFVAITAANCMWSPRSARTAHVAIGKLAAGATIIISYPVRYKGMLALELLEEHLSFLDASGCGSFTKVVSPELLVYEFERARGRPPMPAAPAVQQGRGKCKVLVTNVQNSVVPMFLIAATRHDPAKRPGHAIYAVAAPMPAPSSTEPVRMINLRQKLREHIMWREMRRMTTEARLCCRAFLIYVGRFYDWLPRTDTHAAGRGNKTLRALLDAEPRSLVDCLAIPVLLASEISEPLLLDLLGSERMEGSFYGIIALIESFAISWLYTHAYLVANRTIDGTGTGAELAGGSKACKISL